MSFFRRYKDKPYYIGRIVLGEPMNSFFVKARKNFIENRENSNKGFTLVELIVVLILLSILLGLSTMAIIKWQDWSLYNQQQETAQTLYYAAQNQLSEYEANGTLQEFAASLRDSNDDYLRELDEAALTALTNGEGVAYSLDSIWPESDGKSSEDKYRDSIVTAICKKGDYEAYRNNTLSDAAIQLGAKVVFQLLEGYIYDPQVLNAAIAIEFSPGQGQVFSVCYSDRNEQFIYGEAVTADMVDIRDRSEVKRQTYLFGYYGVDTLSKATDGKQARPKLTEVKLLNEDTLNLSFKVSKYPGATKLLTYTMDVYDKDSNRIVLSVQVDGSKLAVKSGRQLISCPVTRFNYADKDTKEATITELESYDILAWVEADNTVHIVLDAVDFAASSAAYAKELGQGLGTKTKAEERLLSMTKTLSFHRFGLDAENVYCTIQGQGAGYEATAVKKTNTESIYFKKSVLSGKNYSIALSNARHLYNVRFTEDLEKNAYNSFSTKVSGSDFVVDYTVEEDIDWETFVQSGNVYYTKSDAMDAKVGVKKTTSGAQKAACYLENAAFPSIKLLRYGDSMKGQAGLLKSVAPVISGLRITQDANVILGVNDTAQPTGLFEENDGRLESLTLDRITVTGTEKVGAFCGLNAGELKSLSVQNTNQSSVISGKNYVGGIAGDLKLLDDSALHGGVMTAASYENLLNRATIQGTGYVGGIVGMVTVPASLSGKNPSVSIKGCTNYGMLEAVLEGTDPLSARYIGGITGYCKNEIQTDASVIKLENCISSPQYTETALSAYLNTGVADAAAALGDKLKGVYVGGIVGYNEYSTITNCSTKAEAGKNGYVFGRQYVGGIVGFNHGPASGIQGGDNTARGINEANVVGYEYVGGIVGCNADIDQAKSTDIVVPSRVGNIDVKISNWVNQGIVFAVHQYAGGITGYNSGWIFACDSQVGTKESADFFQTTYSGDYAGGIAGYNNGVIGNTMREKQGDGTLKVVDTRTQAQKKISANCNISGSNYVGGIVGYNDSDAIVEDYELQGGNIRGNAQNSSFVGGYAGFNASIHLLLMDDNISARQIVSNPNQVTGQYFVGGCVGGNVINMNGTGVTEVKSVFKTDRVLGTIQADAFVGGFVGYQLLFDATSVSSNPGDTGLDSAFVIQRTMLQKFRESDLKTGLSENQKLLEKVQLLDGITGASHTLDYVITAAADASLSILGSGDSTPQNSFGLIQGKIFVGGVVGYIDPETTALISMVQNTAPIVATAYVENIAEQGGRTKDYAGREIVYRYSYAGGITGRVGKKTTIDNCYNSESGTVRGCGTYTGGMCEVNAGTVIHCRATSFGSGTTDYVGAICGMNKSGARVAICTVENKTISGRSVVGGVAAENFGIISGIVVNNTKMNISGKSVSGGAVTVTEGVCGSIVGFNRGTIEMSSSVQNLTIASNGSYVGGICGINEGTVTNKQADGTFIPITVTGNISGREHVGGVIGKQNTGDNKSIAHYINKASVTATLGNVGGILGENASNNVIESCDNYGVITASASGNAGGIVAKNSSTIRDCRDYETVLTSNGLNGGITAVNLAGATIVSCSVAPENASKGLLEFTGRNSVGGICAQNYGVVDQSRVSSLFLHNYAGSEAGNVGALVGQNMAGATISLMVGNSVDHTQVRSYSSNSNAGGIAGSNYGSIVGVKESGKEIPSSTVECDVQLTPEHTDISSLGGVAGKNAGMIQNISVSGSVIGNLGSDQGGYGGIAGYSGNATKTGATVTVTDCTFDGMVWAKGSGSGVARIGGIVGLNAYDSVIRSCEIGVKEDGTKTSIFGGNIAKVNGDMDVDTAETADTFEIRGYFRLIKEMSDKSSYSYTAGIAGENFGKVLSCDNFTNSKNTRVQIESFSGFTAGIVARMSDGQVSGTAAEPISTGENWVVKSRGTGNDMGDGGIIGMVFAAEDFDYLRNYARVENLYISNNSAGGLIGRLEQRENYGLVISNSENHGDIWGYNRVAGMIATIKYQGVTFDHCVNYGSIHDCGGTGAAGFITEFKSPRSYLNFYHCENHGAITSNADNAGFLIKGDNFQDGVKIYYSDCVNTGVIRRVEFDKAGNETYYYGNYVNAAGKLVQYKVAAFQTANNNITAMENCRNYFGGLTDVNSFTGNDTNKLMSLYNSLDLTNSTTGESTMSPFANAVSGSHNYYFTKKTATDEATTNSSGLYFTITPHNVMYNALANNQVTDYYAPASLEQRFVMDGAEQTIDFDLSYASGANEMGALVLHFGNNGLTGEENKITYEYSATVHYTRLSWNVLASATKTVTVNKKTITVDSAGGTGEIAFDILQDVGYNIDSVKVSIKVKDGTSDAKVYLNGFGWKKQASLGDISPKEQAMISATTLWENTYHTNFTVAFKKAMTITGKAADAYNPGMLLTAMADDNHLQVTTTDADKWQTITVYPRYENNAKGIKQVILYPTAGTSDTTVKYGYYYRFLDSEGNILEEKGSEAAPLVLDAGYGNSQIAIETTAETEKFAALQFFICRLDAKNKVLKGDIYLNGIKWIPKDETTPILLPFNKNDSTYLTKQNTTALAVLEKNGTYYIYPADAYGVNATNIADYAYFTMSQNPISEDFYQDLSSFPESYLTSTSGYQKRYSVYKELDAKFTEFITNRKDEKNVLEKPAVTVSLSSSNYRVSWPYSSEAYQYRLYYELLDSKKNVVYSSLSDIGYETVSVSACYYLIDTEEVLQKWSRYGQGTGGKIRFYVEAVNSYNITHADSGDATNYNSGFSYKETDIKKSIPTPALHLEFISGNRTVIVLDNVQEYAQLGDVADVHFKFSQAKSVNGNAQEVIFSAATGYSAPFTLTEVNLEKDYAFTAWATPKDAVKNQYGRSNTFTINGTLMRNEQLFSYIPTSENYVQNVELPGLFGNTADEMTYQVRYIVRNVDFTYGVELLTYDETLGIWVANTHGSQRAGTRSATGNTTFTMILTDFYEDVLGKDFLVRTYPTIGQNNLCYYARTVATGIPQSSLASNADVCAIMDSDYFTETGERISRTVGENGKLRPGYVLYRNEDGTMDVIYSLPLELYELELANSGEENMASNYMVHTASYHWSNAVDANGYFFYTIRKQIKNVVTDCGSIVVQKAPILGNQYEMGTDAQNRDTLTFHWDVEDALGQSIDISDSSSNLLYRGAEYGLELIGIAMDGSETLLAKVESVKAQSYTFTDTESNWKYGNYLLKVTRLGIRGADDVTEKLPLVSEKLLQGYIRFATLSMPDVSLRRVNGNYDSDNLIYAVEWAPLTDTNELSDLEAYVITVRVNKEQMTAAGMDVSNVTVDHTYTVAANDSGITATGCRAEIDLSDFAGGEILDITVKAKAKADAVNYCDGEDSLAYTLTLPTRLETPNLEKFGVREDRQQELTFQEDKAVLTDVLNQGIPFVLQKDSVETGYYQLAIALYSDKPETEGSSWNEGALLTQYTKENALRMNGLSLSEGSYTYGTNLGDFRLSDYPGYWVKVVARAMADNEISSFWTDEDPNATQKVFWYQIPRVQFMQPELTEGKALRFLKENEGEENTWETEKGTNIWAASFRTLSFSPVEYAGSYEMIVTDRDGVIRTLTFVKSENGYLVTCKKDEEDVVSLGELQTTGPLALDYKVAMTVASFDEQAKNVVAQAQLMLDTGANGKDVITILLPDMLEAGDELDLLEEIHESTTNCTIQAVVAPEKSGTYSSSSKRAWKE